MKERKERREGGRERERERGRVGVCSLECVCVCARTRVRACVRACVRVCVCEGCIFCVGSDEKDAGGSEVLWCIYLSVVVGLNSFSLLYTVSTLSFCAGRCRFSYDVDAF